MPLPRLSACHTGDPVFKGCGAQVKTVPIFAVFKQPARAIWLENISLPDRVVALIGIGCIAAAAVLKKMLLPGERTDPHAITAGQKNFMPLATSLSLPSARGARAFLLAVCV
jgi:hypothetical protein